MRNQLILQVVSKLLIPFLMLFALYVHFHGDFSPGGGFQAGAISAGAVVLYGLIFGLKRAQEAIPVRLVHIGVPLGVLIYAGVGVASVLLGGNYLEYNVLSENKIDGQHLGILLVELGVLTTVFSTMVTIFYTFATRGR